MSLSDSQIVRYSRQILLPAVGGKGQEQLLTCGAALHGQGAALATAAAYLAAGGTSVHSDSDLVSQSELGFLFEASDIGCSRNERLRSALGDFNQDALTHKAGGCLSHAPAKLSGPAPWVLIGQTAPHADPRPAGTLLYRSDQGCAECFTLNGTGWVSLSDEAPQILLGALAALVFQRLCLTLGPSLGGMHVAADGTIAPMELQACHRCG